jgi:hypothetical protein
MPRAKVKMLVKAKPGLLRKTRDAWRNCLMDTIRPKMEVWNDTFLLQVFVGTDYETVLRRFGRFNISQVTG